METFKIITDETLRETIQHGSNRYPFAYYPDNIWKFDFHRDRKSTRLNSSHSV